ncbi:MAG TPA: hypothetical protein VFV38_34910 [Ktedonobacteraceae bacterium]|nr:hypothetical protein [Ktedonobacteraceae bacterium]
MDELVQRLSQGAHPVVVGGPKATREEFRTRLQERGYVFIKFTETQGETDLGMRVDVAATDLSQADFSGGKGIAHIEGTLMLNYVNIRCVAEIRLETLSGTGHLIVLENAQP